MTATTKRLSARTLVGAQGRVVRPAEPRVVEWHAALSGPQHMPQRASKSSALSMGSTLKRTRLPSYQNLTRAIGGSSGVWITDLCLRPAACFTPFDQ